MTDSLLGHRVNDRYLITSLLGNGGMADVYLAHDDRLGRPVALKLIAPYMARNAAFVRRFYNEARILAKLDHEHIVQIYDVGQADDRPFLAMRYVDGRSLAEAIRHDGPWDPHRTARMLTDVAGALDYAHKQGLLHRDVKPANILISRQDRAILTDFGLATAAAAARMTYGGTVFDASSGTLEYMSPEQISGASVGRESDIYALGVVAYEVLSGRLPFEAENKWALGHKILYTAPPSLDTINSKIPRAVANVMQRALSKQPDERFVSATEFAVELTRALNQTSTIDDRTTVVNPNFNSFRPESAITTQPAQKEYTAEATSQTPALVIYLLDLSGSMDHPLGNKTRLGVVLEALEATIRQMVARSTRGSRISRRYIVAVLGYSDKVFDLIGGQKGIDELVAKRFQLELSAMRTTETAKAFAEAEKILKSQLPLMQRSPAPIVCHLTDGEYTGKDPEPIAARIKAMRVPDGNVLMETIFISDNIAAEPVGNLMQWRGITGSTKLTNDYAEKLRRMSSPLPDTYRLALQEYGYHLDPDAVMLLPGSSPELVRLAFQVSGMTGATPVI